MEDLKKSFLVRGNNIVGFDGSGEENTIESISVNGVDIAPDENKNVDITVPSIDGLTKDADLATVAKSGNYEDLDNKPEIPSIEGLAKTTDIPTKVSELENDSKYQTESDVTTTLTDYATKTYVGEQIANTEHLKREIVTVLPSNEEASDNIIYMLKVESATGNDKYQEYMKIDGTVQMVGDTSVDLTDYAKTAEIPTTVAELTDSADYALKSLYGDTTINVGRLAGSTVGDYSTAEGNSTTARGSSSHAEGQGTTASGDYSHAEGYNTTSTGESSHTEGVSTNAVGKGCHAEGNSTVANYENSHAEGNFSHATGFASHAENNTTRAKGGSSHAEGYQTTAMSDISHAEGESTNLAENYVTGDTSNADIINSWNTNKFSLAKGKTSHVEGLNCLALGDFSHAEGEVTIAKGIDSHAEGWSTEATGGCSHAEGNNTEATSDGSHAEGRDTMAYAEYAHAEGYSTVADAYCSHAEGTCTTATGYYSHAEGFHTIANGESQHVQGKYNIADETSAFIIGNGTGDDARSNAMKVDWSGNLEVAGDLKDGSGNTFSNMMSKTNPTGTGSFSLNRKASTTIGTNSTAEGTKATASGSASHAEGGSTTASGSASHAEGQGTTASGSASHAEGSSTAASGDSSHAEGQGTTASGDFSHAEGQSTTASASYTHSEGVNTSAIGQGSHAEGSNLEFSERHQAIIFEEPRSVEVYDRNTDDFIYITVKGSQAFGLNSHAEGCSTLAYGKNSHTEGYHTVADANESHAEGCGCAANAPFAHAEGQDTIASGSGAHAEGLGTIANGTYSHAEGFNSRASGKYSHAEGYYTKATNYASHASGKYNAAMITGGDSSNTTGTAFVIGNGTGSSALSNAFSVQFNGIVKAKSTITASTTADYAEFFEWLDKNPNEEDRVGHFVTLDGDKIKIATDEDDYILGIVSGEPFVLGNGDCDTWNGMFLHDEFRRTMYEPAPKMIEILDSKGNPTGEYEEVEGEYEGTRPILNPDYDPTQEYVSRFDRAEWSPIGMLGVLAVLHDGTAEVNGYVTVNNEGIATKCTRDTRNSYRVIKKVSDKVVEVIFR